MHLQPSSHTIELHLGHIDVSLCKQGKQGEQMQQSITRNYRFDISNLYNVTQAGLSAQDIARTALSLLGRSREAVMKESFVKR